MPLPPLNDDTRAWLEIDLTALRANTGVAKSLAGPRNELIAVVKADAYGHGLVGVARALEREVSLFGVAALAEACELQACLGQRSGVGILLLGALLPDEAAYAVAQDWQISVSTEEELLCLAGLAGAVGRRAKVHLVADTGMGRMGAVGDAFLTLCRAAAKEPTVEVVGLASHLPSADEDDPFTRAQLAGFESLTKAAQACFSEQPPRVHVLNSAGLLRYGVTETPAWVRPGIMLYGIAPEERYQVGLREVMQLKARVRLVRELPAGHGVSYGRGFVLQHAAQIATVSIGYGDGYRRSLSGRGAQVLVHGQRCPVLGRVTMDQIMVDVTALPTEAQRGDEVVLFGEQLGATISIREVADWAGTIPWEIMTGITKRIPRVYRR